MAGDAFLIKGTVDVATGPLKSGLNEASGLVSGFGKTVAGAGAAVATAFGTATIAGIGAASAGLGVAVKSASDFEKVMSGVKAVSGSSAAEMKQLQKLALDLGAATSYSATEAGEGIEELVKAGVSVGEIMGGAAKASLDLAAAGGIKVADAATIAAQAMNTFGIKGSEMGKVADTIAGAANASAIDVGQFKFSLQAAGSVAATVGLSFDDLATSIAVMGQNGVVGSDAGTSLKTMLMGLQPQTDKQKQLFKDLGLTLADGSNAFFDASGKIKSMADVSGILQNATKNMTEQQKIATFEVLFGSDAIRAAAIMAKTGAGGFTEMAAAMGKVSAAEVAETRLDNLAGSMEKLKGSLSTLAITVGLTLTPSLRKLVDMATDSVNAWQPAITAYAEKIPGAIDTAITKIAGFIPRLKSAFVDAGQVVGAFVGLDLDSYAAGWDTWAGIVTRSIELVTTAVSDVWSAVKTAVPAAIDLLKQFSPVVIEVGRSFVKNIADTINWIVKDVVPPFRDIFIQTVDFFRTSLQPAMQSTSSVFRGILGDSIKWISEDVWPDLVWIARDTVSFWNTSLLPAIQAVAGPLRTALGETLQWVARDIWPKFLGAATVVVDFFKTNVAPMLPEVARVIRDVLGAGIKWVAEEGWPKFLGAATTVYTFVKDNVVPILSDLAGWLKDTIPVAIGYVTKAWETVSERIGPIIQAVFSGDIKSAISKAGDAFSEFASLAIGWISDQVAQIDWKQVWATAKDVVVSMAQWFGDVATKFAGWVSEKVAMIDWAVVWQTAKDVSLSMYQWFADVATRFTTWLGEKVAAIDWVAVWQMTKDMASAMQQSFTAEASKIKWDEVLAGAANAAADMYKWLGETIANIDWKSLGDSTGAWLGSMFSDAATKTDWAKIGESVANLLGAMLGTAITAVAAWESFTKGFTDGFVKAITGLTPTQLQEALGAKLKDVLNESWKKATAGWVPSPFGGGSSGNTGMSNTTTGGDPGSAGSSGASFGPIDNSSRASFVRTAYPYMLKAAKGNKALAEWMLAKAISENGAVGSGRDFAGNNFSGIKGVGDAGSFSARTWEDDNKNGRADPEEYRNQDFAAYSTPEKGFEAFMNFLLENNRYKPALENYNQTQDPMQLFKDINAAGYATNPRWWADVDAIRTGSVLPITKDLGTLDETIKSVDKSTIKMSESVKDLAPPIKDASDAVSDLGGEVSDVGDTVSDVSQEAKSDIRDAAQGMTADAGNAGKAIMGLGDTVGLAGGKITKESELAQQKVAKSFDLMSGDSMRSIERLSTGMKTTMADASGNIITTTTNMSGKMIDQTATLANGVTVKMSDLAKGTITNVEQMAEGVKTTMTDAAGNVVTTVTDLQGQVVSQTATMATEASGNVQKLGTEVKASITDMAGGTLTVTRTMAGDLVSTVRDATGGVVEQYRSMAGDVAGQAADLARAAAMTNGQISSSAQQTMGALAGAANTAGSAYDQFGRKVQDASGKVRGFTQDAKWLAEHGFVVPGYSADAKWLADHGYVVPAMQGRSTGGPTLGNGSYWVGEYGKPEMFTPEVPGTISTLDQLRAIGNPSMESGRIERHVIDFEIDGLMAERIYVRGRDITIDRTGSA